MARGNPLQKYSRLVIQHTLHICEGFCRIIRRYVNFKKKKNVLDYICKGDDTKAGSEVLPLNATVPLFARMLVVAHSSRYEIDLEEV